MRHSLGLPEAIAQLCPTCTLCCNGVLFADVELRAGDDDGRLKQLGLRLHPKGRKLAFSQPCTCLKEGWCRIYSDRPKRCRTFECRLLKQVASNEAEVNSTRAVIRQARRLVDEVRQLIILLGNHADDLALSSRYAQVMSEPIDLSGDEAVLKRRTQLMFKMDELMQLLQGRFLA